jgi:hypothetical protein
MRKLTLGAPLRRVSLAAPVPTLPTALERGKAERTRLYGSGRWRRMRRAFLKANPWCACGARAVVADHKQGHQHESWRAAFWDTRRWQPMCNRCHGAKSRRELQAWQDRGEGAMGV